MSGSDASERYPGALHPMVSGDGLVVRLRPYNGRLRRAQADGIASLAAAHGNSFLDLSSGGHLQIRGVREQSYRGLIEGLRAMGLVDATPRIERLRNILVMPFWQPGDETEALAAELTHALANDDAPDLPDAFGFAVDTGRKPVLQSADADIRLECDAGGGLVLVADGMTTGKPVSEKTAVSEAMALARWFADNRGAAPRMKSLIGAGMAPQGHFVPRQTSDYVPAPGGTPNGALLGLAFGQMGVDTLSSLAKHGGLRFTPWRLILVESARQLPQIDGLISDPSHPLLRITACAGAPHCLRALNETRSVGHRLAPDLGSTQTVHISGCALGCAHPGPAPVTITATKTGYDMIKNGTAADTPVRTGLSPSDLNNAI